MRMALAATLVASCTALAPPASAEPVGTCPPACNRIPETAWVNPSAIPLDSVYAWPGLPGLAVTARSPRFRSRNCAASRCCPATRAGMRSPSGP